ncbi:MAG: ketoacyl-ACP synthase III [Candidatus Woesearchaeota archaeon]|nr:ketoacyl-ACP synthase III [Candidatus Woesearchaeota archaeon]
MINAAVLESGYYVPHKRVTNAAFEGKTLYEHDGLGNRTGKSVVTGDAWIVERTGIRERRYAEAEDQPQVMAAKAIKRALRRSNLQASDLEGIIIATVTNKQRYPSCAQQVREQLGARNARDCYDIAAACAGFPVALADAALRIRQPDLFTKPGRIYAVVGVEKLTNHMNVDDPDMNDPLFGDGAGAAIVGPTENSKRGIQAVYMAAKTENGNLGLIVEDPMQMLRMTNGPKVFKVAVPGLVEAYQALREKTGWYNPDIILIPHQANNNIIENARIRLELEKRQIINTVRKFGNPSAASIPIAMAIGYRKQIIKPNTQVFVIGFGASMIIAGVAFVA